MGKSIVLSEAGDPCPQCGRQMQIRAHAKLGRKQIEAAYYYSRWFVCVADDCSTKQVMPDAYKVVNLGAKEPFGLAPFPYFADDEISRPTQEFWAVWKRDKEALREVGYRVLPDHKGEWIVCLPTRRVRERIYEMMGKKHYSDQLSGWAEPIVRRVARKAKQDDQQDTEGAQSNAIIDPIKHIECGREPPQGGNHDAGSEI